MPEFGLTLPDHDLTPAEFKDLARRLGRAAFTPLFLKFYERVVTGEATIEEQRKALADIARWTGVEEERKTDPNANLPVFNIVFGSAGSKSASIEVAEIVQETAMSAPMLDIPPLDEEELQILEGIQHAQRKAGPPPDGAQPDAAEAQPAPGPPDAQVQPAGCEPSATPRLPRERQRGRREGLRLAAQPEALPVRRAEPAGLPETLDAAPAPQVATPAISRDPFEDALNALDQALGI